ncbi:addiction module killer protein [Alcanivorax xiamenensis]|uniref:Addiction module killer protein n=1 Tax=Alcanivorax xiamenensis TaxID=1177156 RepID=A0ABQ6Y4U7_9GAMM|nr:type II toxin-antitoxin system RelE/ParE family toxin [Alcanivorax xiamenensis]KAF0804236.1 addiction module killer protein [Alcanivorax xiamenensis]
MNAPDASGSPGGKASSASEHLSLDNRIQKDTIQTYTILDTQEFRLWLSKVRDPVGKAALLRRLDRLRNGQIGDHKYLGNRLHEIRLHLGPGYRIYYMYPAPGTCLLLTGGTKASQERDIRRAQALAKLIRRQQQGGHHETP